MIVKKSVHDGVPTGTCLQTLLHLFSESSCQTRAPAIDEHQVLCLATAWDQSGNATLRVGLLCRAGRLLPLTVRLTGQFRGTQKCGCRPPLLRRLSRGATFLAAWISYWKGRLTASLSLPSAGSGPARCPDLVAPFRRNNPSLCPLCLPSRTGNLVRLGWRDFLGGRTFSVNPG